MAEKYKETAVVVSQEQIADGIYGMWLQTEQIARAAKPGQFISVYCHSAEKLLPRPISLCEIDREQGLSAGERRGKNLFPDRRRDRNSADGAACKGVKRRKAGCSRIS